MALFGRSALRLTCGTIALSMSSSSSSSLQSTATLSNGVQLPLFGLGTFEMHDPLELREAIPAALAEGYRLIDTAQCYRNEATIGKILREVDVSREELFLVSKLHPACSSYADAIKRIEQSLRDLRTTYIDLFLIHWPGTTKIHGQDPRNKQLRKEKWQALQDCYARGLFRAIGVSNFSVAHLEEFAEYHKESHSVNGDSSFVMPMVNQIELHVAWNPLEDIHCCRQMGIAIQAYSSLGRAELLAPQSSFLLQHSWLQDLAKAREYIDSSGQTVACSVQQIVLRWAWQHGYAIIPKSRLALRIKRNAEAITHVPPLSEEDMQRIDAITNSGENNGRVWKACWDPRIIA